MRSTKDLASTADGAELKVKIFQCKAFLPLSTYEDLLEFEKTLEGLVYEDFVSKLMFKSNINKHNLYYFVLGKLLALDWRFV